MTIAVSPPTPARPSHPAVEAAAAAARWALGVVFIYMGMVKALHPEPFIGLVRQYEVIHTPWLLNVVSAFLPWFEVFCGILLIAGAAVRGAAASLLLMLIPFTFLIWRRGGVLAGAKAVALCAVKFDCGCGNGEVWVCHKLAENTVLILLTIWILSRRDGKWSARFSLFPAPPR